MTACEEILAGRADIRNYDIDNDFDDEEMTALLEAGIISTRDIGAARASDLLIDGVLDYDRYPFSDFPPYEQIRQLERCAIMPSEFLRQVDFEDLDGDLWLYLLTVLPRLADRAPWAKIRAEGSAAEWTRLLKRRPEFAPHAEGILPPPQEKTGDVS